MKKERGCAGGPFVFLYTRAHTQSPCLNAKGMIY